MVEGASKKSIATEDVEYGVTYKMKGFLAWDPAIEGKRPAVLVVHEVYGQGEYVRNRAIQLAEMGYLGFAIDMFGEGKTTCDIMEGRTFIEESTKVFDTAITRFTEAVDYIKKHEKCDANRVAAIGYCYGGMIVLNMARAGVDINAVASFHGSLASKTSAEKGKFKGKVLVCNGEADTSVTKEHIEAFKKEFEEAGIDYKFVNYPEATHGWTNPQTTERAKKSGRPLFYHEKADKESWAELTTFLEGVFKA